MRWIVGPNDGRTVREILARAGADADAISDGRVFVGLKRVRREDERVREGDAIQVAPRRQRADEAVRVLAQTGDLVAVDKPAGIPTIADHAGAAHALVALVARTLGRRQVEMHPTSRLDRDVSGVVVFACTLAAARRLKDARSAGVYERRYVAIAASNPPGDRGTWDAPIGRALDPRLRTVAGKDAIDAKTHFVVCGRARSGAALLAIAPVTGRTHQIRVHAAYASAPLIGDRAYGGPTRLTLANGRVVQPRRIALHAAHVVVPDERGVPLAVSAAVPSALLDLWCTLGGDTGAWEVAASCAVG